MKKMLFFCASLVVSCMVFISCSKSDSTSTTAMLIGTWKLISTNNTSYFAGSGSYLNGTYTVTFNNDGTGMESQNENGTTFYDTYNYTWAVRGDSLTIITTAATGTNGIKSSLDGVDDIANVTSTTLTILHTNHYSPVRDTFLYTRQ